MKKSLRFASACLLGAVLVSCNRKSETELGAKVAHEKYSLEWVTNDIPATMMVGKATTGWELCGPAFLSLGER